MPRTVAIISPMVGHSLDSTLQEALGILRSQGVPVETTAQHIAAEGRAIVTILLRYVDDKPRATRILSQAGIHTER